MLKEHTLWTILIRKVSVANDKWFYRNLKYLGLKVLKCNSASRSILGKVFSISLCLAKRWFHNQWSYRTIVVQEKKKKKKKKKQEKGGGGGVVVNNLPKPDELSHWKWPFVWHILQRCPHRSRWNLWIYHFTCRWGFANVIKVKDLDIGRECWIIQVNPA